MVGKPYLKDSGKLGPQYQRKIVEVPEEEHLREEEKRPLAWLIMVAGRAQKDKI